MEQRFLSKINKIEDGCWEWNGRLFDGSGYGQYSINSVPVLAHRHSYKVYKGEIPDGMCVLHSCDNRKCVNPAHLRIGTHQDNMNDKVERNRQSKGDTHYARTNPEKMARGDKHGSKTHPEALIRGDDWRTSHKTHILNLSGSKNINSKLTDDDVCEIRILSKFAFSHREISKMYNVSRPVISKVIRFETYKSI